MKTITRNVISYCDIPEDIRDKHWMSEYQNGCFVPYTIDRQTMGELDTWLIIAYPELIGFEFLIEIDY